MNRRRVLLTVIPLVLLVACAPDPDDGPNASRGSATETTGVTGSTPTGDATQTTIGSGNGSNQTTDTAVTSSTAASVPGSTTVGGSGGSSGSGSAGGSTGSGSSSGSGGAAGSGGSGGSGGSTGTTLPGGSAGGSGGTPGSGSAVPTTTLPRDKVALDLNAQTVYGIGVGPASATDVLATVSAHLGDVTNDTGWYTLPPTSDGGIGDCLANQESRILRWGDLSIAFWRKAGVASIWSWSVGDPSVSGYGDRREPNLPASPAPTGLRTNEDIGVGSTFDDVAAAYKQRFQFFPSTPEDTTGVHLATAADTTPAGAAISMLEIGGPIIGIGSTLHFC